MIGGIEDSVSLKFQTAILRFLNLDLTFFEEIKIRDIK